MMNAIFKTNKSTCFRIFPIGNGEQNVRKRLRKYLPVYKFTGSPVIAYCLQLFTVLEQQKFANEKRLAFSRTTCKPLNL